jgi:membrane protease YdiL (CAAX protease family)
MLNDKPWRPELVLRLLAGLFASLMLGIIVVNGYLSLAGEAARNGNNYLITMIGTFVFHGVALVLINVFLRQHGFTWPEAFGFNQPHLGRAMLLAFLVTLLVLPIAWSLSALCVKLLTVLHLSVEPQQAVTTLKNAQTEGQRNYYALEAVFIAPIVEELIFRGILYPAIKQRGFHKLAIWGTSIFFAAIHNSLVTLIPLTFLAVILTLLYETTRNLLAPIVAHSLFNLANYLAISQGWAR